MYDEVDEVLWNYAAENELIIDSKDHEFQQMQMEKGSPLAVVKLSIGNCTNERIRQSLLRNEYEIKNWRHQYGLIIIG